MDNSVVTMRLDDRYNSIVKATCKMGYNKPKEPFNEHKFMVCMCNTRAMSILPEKDALSIKDVIVAQSPHEFLAFAARSNNPNGSYLEHWVFIKEVILSSWTEGRLYAQRGETVLEKKAFIDDKGEPNGFYEKNLSYFRKASDAEIKLHYMKKTPPRPKYTGDLKDMPEKVLTYLGIMQTKYLNRINLQVFDNNILTAKTNGGFNWSEEDNHSAVVSDILLKNQHHLLKEDGTYTSEALARINKEPVEIKPYYGQIDLQEKKLSTFPENSTSPYIVRIKNKFVKNIPLYKEEPVIIKQVTIKIEKEDENFQVDLGF